MPHGFRVTTIGAYHLRRWLGTFAYLDAVLFDTPIFDERATATISRDLESFDIRHRLERTTAFRNYLTGAGMHRACALRISTGTLSLKKVRTNSTP